MQICILLRQKPKSIVTTSVLVTIPSVAKNTGLELCLAQGMEDGSSNHLQHEEMCRTSAKYRSYQVMIVETLALCRFNGSVDNM